jgi:RNA polymerase sigma-70 factor (sigma-E family)
VDELARRDFSDYVAARQHTLLRRAMLLTGSRADAEDLVQTTLAKAYRAWGRIREREAVDAYVMRIMVNTRTSWLRRPRRETPTDDVPETAVHAEAPDVVVQTVLRDVLADLPRRQRAAVVLRFYDDLTERETAQLLGISVGTVKSSVSRALDRLRADPRLQQVTAGPHDQTTLRVCS